MTVGSHVERGLDLSAYRTFDWGARDALPVGDPRLDRNPFFNDHLTGAIEKGLAARGLQLVAAGRPDLLIHYHANVSTRMNVRRVDGTPGYCSEGDCPIDIVDYEAGTLVLDVVNARTNALIWRGWARHGITAMLNDPDRMEATINEAVTRMLRRFPQQP
jgi:hypothetical protein